MHFLSFSYFNRLFPLFFPLPFSFFPLPALMLTRQHLHSKFVDHSTSYPRRHIQKAEKATMHDTRYCLSVKHRAQIRQNEEKKSNPSQYLLSSCFFTANTVPIFIRSSRAPSLPPYLPPLHPLPPYVLPFLPFPPRLPPIRPFATCVFLPSLLKQPPRRVLSALCSLFHVLCSTFSVLCFLFFRSPGQSLPIHRLLVFDFL